jgi:mannose-6-phosphate isomerase-like protein (cupin superfamily)
LAVFTSIKEGPGFEINRFVAIPSQSLSLQFHHRRRAEHSVVVMGEVIVRTLCASFLISLFWASG